MITTAEGDTHPDHEYGGISVMGMNSRELTWERGLVMVFPTLTILLGRLLAADPY